MKLEVCLNWFDLILLDPNYRCLLKIELTQFNCQLVLFEVGLNWYEAAAKNAPPMFGKFSGRFHTVFKLFHSLQNSASERPG